jgi:hypothetical protein
MLPAEKRIDLAGIKDLNHLEINFQLKGMPEEGINNYPSGPAPAPRGNEPTADYRHHAGVRVNSVTANVRTRPV